MNITVKLFAMLDRYAPDQQKAGEPFSVDIPEGSTIDDLVAFFGIPDREVKVAFVDGRARAGVFRLKPDAEVGIFPPVGGG
ncbi:MAG: MoaD/ThiS family protein [Anaerolineales bacterium]|nr:MAG: MoaD/ThiS family protein [Anaerolineales bacterium]